MSGYVSAKTPKTPQRPLELREALGKSQPANRAFKKLIAAGCDPDDLLHWLDFCCSDHATKHAIENREVAQGIASFGKHLLSMAKKLQMVEASQKKKLIFKAMQHPEFRGLSETLQSYAQCLINEAAELKQSASARVRGVPGLLTGWLAARVEGSTDGTHYSEIATLMEFTYSIRAGIDREISSPAVAKQVKRFRQKHSMAYSHMRNMASRQYGSRKEEYIQGSSRIKSGRTP